MGVKMNAKEFAIVSALARASMKNQNSAIRHHIKRLSDVLIEHEEEEQANVLIKILNPEKDVPNVMPILSRETN